MADAFYLPLGGGRFSPTEHTAGPWTPDAQHFGPPSALLVRALEEIDGGPPRQLARLTVEILGPAPLTELTVRARLERPGHWSSCCRRNCSPVTAPSPARRLGG